MRPRVNILHVIEGTFAYGGTPLLLLKLVSVSDKERFSHHFLVYANTSSNLNEQLRESGATVDEVRRPHNWDVRLLCDIVRTSRRYQCDIINTYFARPDIYGAVAGRLVGVPVIKSVHSIRWNDSRLLQTIDRLLYGLRVLTICNSESSQRRVVRDMGARNTTVIYNGVPDCRPSMTAEERAMKRAGLGVPANALLVLHVGQMLALRDQSAILPAIKECVVRGVDAYLAFAGEGPLRERLEAESRELGLSERVLFLGNRSDVPELNFISDAYVNMARKEAFGIAVVEAMQCGLPVVLARAGALPELVVDGVSGILVPPGDSSSLANALINLAKDKELAKRLGEEARRRALTEFSIGRYVRDMENAYSNVALKSREFCRA